MNRAASVAALRGLQSLKRILWPQTRPVILLAADAAVKSFGRRRGVALCAADAACILWPQTRPAIYSAADAACFFC